MKSAARWQAFRIGPEHCEEIWSAWPRYAWASSPPGRLRLTSPSGEAWARRSRRSDNYFLQNTPLGTTFKSLSTVNLDVLARTPGWRYLLSSNVSYYNYFGDGADATNPTSGTPINETFRVDHATDFARYFCCRDLYPRRCCRDPIEGKRRRHRERHDQLVQGRRWRDARPQSD